MDKKDLLFKKCRCLAYLAPAKDGRCIEHYKPEQSPDGKDHFVLNAGKGANKYEGGTTEYAESECCGEYDLEKTYYARKELEFSGIVVGFKDIVTEGYLGVDYEEPYYGSPFYRVFKAPKTVVPCAIVFFASNQKRYVPVEDVRYETRGRLIDADRLMRVIRKNFGFSPGAEVMAQLIDIAPTEEVI